MESIYNCSWNIFRVWIRSSNYRVRSLYRCTFLYCAVDHHQQQHSNLISCAHVAAADYIMVGRASILLRGLAHMLQQSRSVANSWKPPAERVLNEDS